MKVNLTPKQEKFCHLYLEKGNASEAYRSSYSASRMKLETIHRKAKELLDNGKVSARIQILQDELKEISCIKKERLLNEMQAILESRITDFFELKTVNDEQTFTAVSD